MEQVCVCCQQPHFIRRSQRTSTRSGSPAVDLPSAALSDRHAVRDGVSPYDALQAQSQRQFVQDYWNFIVQSRRMQWLMARMHKYVPEGSLQLGGFATLATPWGGFDVGAGVVGNTDAVREGEVADNLGVYVSLSGLSFGLDASAGGNANVVTGPISNVSGESTTGAAGYDVIGASYTSNRQGAYNAFGVSLNSLPGTRGLLPTGSGHVSMSNTIVITLSDVIRLLSF